MCDPRTCLLAAGTLAVTVVLSGCALPLQSANATEVEPRASEVEKESYFETRGTQLRRRGELEAAVESYRRALSSDPERIGAREGMGIVQLQRGNDALAEAMLVEVAEAAPERLTTLNALGALYDRQERFDEARSRYEQALAIVPRSATTLSNLGYSLYLQGQHVEAERRLREAVAIDPSLDTAWANIALIRVLEDDQAGARKAFENVGQRHQVLNNLGFLNLLVDDRVTATKNLQASASAAPGYYGAANTNLGQIRREVGRSRLSDRHGVVIVARRDEQRQERRISASDERNENVSILLNADREERAVAAAEDVSTAAVDLADNASAEPDPESVVTAADDDAGIASRNEPILDPSPAVIASVQTELERLGLNAGVADGQLGPQSFQAIRLFKVARRLPVTNELTPAFLSELGVSDGAGTD